MIDEQIISGDEQNISLADENLALKAELEALKASIENEKKEKEMAKEFAELFQGVSVDDIPESVYEYLKINGGTLAGAFAVYHRRAELAKKKADEKAFENILKTPGSASVSANGASDRLFTSDEIRSMNQTEVRKNYKQIMKSLKYGK